MMDSVILPPNVWLANLFVLIAWFVLPVILVITLVLVVSKKMYGESITLTVLLGILFATSFFFIFNLLATFLTSPIFKIFFK